MDELAAAAGRDPLEFRLAHLENRPAPRRARGSGQAVRLGLAVEEEAAERRRRPRLRDRQGLVRGRLRRGGRRPREGLDRRQARLPGVTSAARSSTPPNLLNQVKGGLIMGLGPALRRGDAVRRRQDAQRLVRPTTGSLGSRTCRSWTSTCSTAPTCPPPAPARRR